MDERALQNPEDHGVIQQLVSELAQLARLVAVSDEHRHELARLSGLVERLARASHDAPAERGLPADLDKRLNALQSAIDGAAQSAAAALATQRPAGASEDAGEVRRLSAELAQMARLVAVSDEHRHELARLSGLVGNVASALDNAPADPGLPAVLDKRLDALQSAIDGVALTNQQPASTSEDAGEVRRLSTELAEIARLVALTDADRRRLSELHRMASTGDAVSVSRQIEILHRDIRRLVGAAPELANPAWHRDRVARRQAEADVIRLERELAELGQQFVRQGLELEETRKSRRKLKASVEKLRRHADALGQRHNAQKRELDQLRKSYRKLKTTLDTPAGLRGKARHWARTASVAQPIRWAYRQLKGGA